MLRLHVNVRLLSFVLLLVTAAIATRPEEASSQHADRTSAQGEGDDDDDEDVDCCDFGVGGVITSGIISAAPKRWVTVMFCGCDGRVVGFSVLSVVSFVG